MTRSGRICVGCQTDGTANSRFKELSYENTFMKQGGCTTACATATWAVAAKRAQTRAVLANMVRNVLLLLSLCWVWLLLFFFLKKKKREKKASSNFSECVLRKN